jgi:hypothetical protein
MPNLHNGSPSPILLFIHFCLQTPNSPIRSLLSPGSSKPSLVAATHSMPNLHNGCPAPARDKGKDLLLYADVDHCPDLEARMLDFAVSLFWVLESKRLDRSHEFLDRMPLLLAPAEKRDVVGLDTDSR